MYGYSGVFSGATLTFSFRYPDTAVYYGGALKASGECEAIVIPPEDVSTWMNQWKGCDPSYAEYVISCNYACDALMRQDRVVFHGASFLWNDSAWLFSAPSGTGKTTQLRLWEKLFPGQMEILNGDKPVLELRPDGKVMVHPSPWKGKENYGRDDIVAPLGGIILLTQAKENRIRRMAPAEAARSLFGRIYSTFNTEAEVLLSADILDRILTSVPVWLLENKGDEASALLTHETLLKERIDL